MVSKDLVKSAAFAILETFRTSWDQLHANNVPRAVIPIQHDRIQNVISASLASRSNWLLALLAPFVVWEHFRLSGDFQHVTIANPARIP